MVKFSLSASFVAYLFLHVQSLGMDSSQKTTETATACVRDEIKTKELVSQAITMCMCQVNTLPAYKKEFSQEKKKQVMQLVYNPHFDVNYQLEGLPLVHYALKQHTTVDLYLTNYKVTVLNPYLALFLVSMNSKDRKSFSVALNKNYNSPKMSGNIISKKRNAQGKSGLVFRQQHIIRAVADFLGTSQCLDINIIDADGDSCLHKLFKARYIATPGVQKFMTQFVQTLLNNYASFKDKVDLNLATPRNERDSEMRIVSRDTEVRFGKVRREVTKNKNNPKFETKLNIRHGNSKSKP